jgi:hypothetical protein
MNRFNENGTATERLLLASIIATFLLALSTSAKASIYPGFEVIGGGPLGLISPSVWESVEFYWLPNYSMQFSQSYLTIKSGTVIFNSGDGRSEQFDIPYSPFTTSAPLGGGPTVSSTVSYGASFDYTTPGTYLVSYSYIISYSETDPTGMNIAIPVDTTFDYADSGSGQATVEILVSPAPLPAALPLFATGAGLFDLLGFGRKRKTVSSMAA